MKHLLIICLLIVFVHGVEAQQMYFHKQWDYRYGGYGSDVFGKIISADDEGYILALSSWSGMDGDKSYPNYDTTLFTPDYWAIKINNAGIKLWDKVYGGYRGDNLSSGNNSLSGGHIFGGSSNSLPGGDKTESPRGGIDYWIVKTDGLGNKQWDKCFGGAKGDYLLVVIPTRDYGYILGGYSESPLSGDKTQPNWDSTCINADYWVVKVDSAGNKMWDKRFGGESEEIFYDVIQTNDGGFLLAGSSASGISGDKTQDSWHGNPQDYDYWVVKIDSLGNKQWDKRFGGLRDDFLVSVSGVVLGGGYILAGYSSSGVGGDKTEPVAGVPLDTDYWVVKIDSSGNKEWDKDYGGIYGERLGNMVVTTDGGFLLSGTSASNAGIDKSEDNLGSKQIWIVKIDNIGNKQWDKTLFTVGEEYYAYSIETSDGCYLVGSTSQSFGVGGYKTQQNYGTPYDSWLIKFCMDTVTGIAPLSGGERMAVNCYPNPFVNEISIALQGEGIRTAIFTITNVLDETIYHRKEENLATGYTKMLDLSFLPAGIYYMQVTANGTSTTRQLVKL